jgi:nucleolar complex protein 2
VLVAWLAESGAGIVGFPEVVTPIIVSLRRSLKVARTGSGNTGNGSSKSRGGGSGVESGVKTMVERIEETAKWLLQKRASVTLGPGRVDAVKDWERDMRAALRDESPLGRYVKVLNKTREKRKALVEKARKGEAEIVGEDDED